MDSATRTRFVTRFDTAYYIGNIHFGVINLLCSVNREYLLSPFYYYFSSHFLLNASDYGLMRDGVVVNLV